MQHRCSTRKAAKDRIRDVTADRSPDDMGLYRTAPEVKDPELPLLQIRGVTVRFGPIVALSNVTFDVRRGEILGLIGPNGAGKTTLFNCLSRLCEVERGAIILDGRSLLGAAARDRRRRVLAGLPGAVLEALRRIFAERHLPRHHVARAGIGRTFQHLGLFNTMSVTDNVLVGTHVRERGGFWADALRLPSLVAGERRARERVRQLIERLDLTAVAHTPVGGLPFPVKKRVELARALAAEPKLLLLDEPAGGLNHEEVGRLGELIRAVRDGFGVTILMVEHHLNFVMRVSDRVVALDFGRTLAEGTPAEMQANPEVIRAYLGAPS
jgi:branched-chain amino acid transport system ATP-binding protein